MSCSADRTAPFIAIGALALLVLLLISALGHMALQTRAGQFRCDAAPSVPTSVGGVL